MSIFLPTKRAFTLIEMLIVTAIAAMIFAAALPRISSIPRRLIVEKACNDISRAFDETALRARTSGQNQSLTLLPGDDACFTVSANTQNLSHSWIPPIPPPASGDGDQESSSGQNSPFVNSRTRYPISFEIVWDTDELNYDEETGIIFSFFADGQAAGPDLQFTIKNRTFSLKLNRVTAQVSLEEITE